MAEASAKRGWTRPLSWLALALSVGGVVAALVAALGSGAEAWSFGVGFGILRYAFYAAIAGGLLAIAAFVLSRRGGMRHGGINLAALLVALLFTGYLGNQIATARSVPAIHDVSTDLADPPQFRTLAVRADNLEDIPDDDRPELAALDPEKRWKAIHREAYGDIRTVRLPMSVPAALKLAHSITIDAPRRWKVARVDPGGGTIEATATTLFFRFKDDVVVRVRPDPRARGSSIVDMRSISRVGGSDVGVNAARIRDFLEDLQDSAASA